MKEDTKEIGLISPDMTILDVVGTYRETEKVFRQYDKKAGVCLCCQALFDPLKVVAHKYGLDLGELLKDLEAVSHPKDGQKNHRAENL